MLIILMEFEYSPNFRSASFLPLSVEVFMSIEFSLFILVVSSFSKFMSFLRRPSADNQEILSLTVGVDHLGIEGVVWEELRILNHCHRFFCIFSNKRISQEHHMI